MGIKSYVTDPKTGLVAEVDAGTDEKQALVVATRDLKVFAPGIKLFLNDTHGEDMAQNGGTGGTPELVHDGVDKVLWTASAIIGAGNWDFTQADVHAKDAVATVVNFAALAGDTLTITIDGGAPDVVTEGIDWNAAVSNDVTATDLALAINGLAGVSATATLAVVTIIADAGSDITAITTSDAVNLTSSAQAIDATTTTNNDIAQLTRGAGAIDLSAYVSITGWIYITAWPGTGTKSVNFKGWNTGTGLIVGLEVNLGSYINTASLNVWQQFSIPLTDMNLQASSIDAFRITTVDLGPGAPPDYFLDLIVIEQAGAGGGPFQYDISLEKGALFYANSLKISMARPYDTTEANGTMPGLGYDDLLGATLTSGLLFQIIKDKKITLSASIMNFADMIYLPGYDLKDMMYDGTNTFVTIEIKFDVPYILDRREEDGMRFVVQDDLSSFVFFRAVLGGKVEHIE